MIAGELHLGFVEEVVDEPDAWRLAELRREFVLLKERKQKTHRRDGRTLDGTQPPHKDFTGRKDGKVCCS